MKNPKVSVIIPMYNVETYLRECLDSVVKQTLQDFEVICVDDGSPDRSAEIAAEYVSQYDQFKMIRKENGGLSSARNVGLEIAQGEYVCFLDSDDYIDSHALEDLSEKADSHELDIVFFDADSVYEDDDAKKKYANRINGYVRLGDYSEICTGQSMFAKMQNNKEYRTNACLQFFRRSFLENNHLRFYEGILHEDVLFTFQCVMLARKTTHLNKAYYFHRVHDDSIMTKPKSIRNVDGCIVSFLEALIFLRNIEIEENVAPIVIDYLYRGCYRAAYYFWNELDEAEKEQSLIQGDIAAECLLYCGKKAVAVENYRNRLIRKNEKLTQELVRLRKKPWGVLGWHWKCFVERTKKIFKVWLQNVENNLQHTNPLRCLFVKLYQKIGGKAPLVSFILPVYNVEEFLPQCLDGLIQQTMHHIEIICVDDGSTDGSLKILKEYAEKDRRIKVFTQKNQFAGAARNFGLSKASGEYVVFLDSDDFFSTELARLAYFTGKVNNADVVLFGAKHFDNQTKEFKEAKWLFKERYIPNKQPFSYKDCPNFLYQITTPAPWTKMFRRKFILDTGLQFQTLQNTNDLFFTYSALAMACRIATVNSPLVYYRVGMSTNLQATKKKDPLCFYEAYKALHDKLAELGILDELRQSYVNVTLGGCGHNLDTVQDVDAKQQICNKLRNGGFEELELLGYDSEYYYDQNRYRQMMEIMDISVTDDDSMHTQ